ncbi:TIGR03643 family protein [Cyclobacterium lianum]|uniref:TIGR03643 family protein n=1 Tax=Cyclobacterium lianum TaxID=388280 RepID=A0A1M7PVR8_9BACT|nr:TIGR03643 family protein [Cyclobacterium lianum]SHN21642.1 TIGR03643 family protein [Cyclobacterium lianum]
MALLKKLTEREIDRIIEMAWEDRTTFDAIFRQFGMPEKEVIKLMRREMKESAFKRWRKRVQNRQTKHQKNRPGGELYRFKCSRQKPISLNKIT